MTELTLSVMFMGAAELRLLKAALADFEALTEHHVTLRSLNWETAREELNRMAIYGEGSDVTQIGSTWLRDFVDMGVLRPFTALELQEFGPASDFVPAAWQSVQMPPAPEVWAIPWLVDARFVFYRRDVLAQSGLAGRDAFSSAQAFADTLAQLQASGVALPLTLPTQHSWMLLHNAAPWVWEAGGNFVSADGKRLTFDQPETLIGLTAHLALRHYLAPEVRGLSDMESDAAFWGGRAAVAISGSWLLGIMALNNPELLDHVGIAPLLTTPFVGGSHLALWKHTRSTHAALELVRFLTALEFQRTCIQELSFLPARLEALRVLDTDSRVVGTQLQRAMSNGRSFYPTKLWGIIEQRLVNTLSAIWEEALRVPEVDVVELLRSRLKSLAGRLELMLQ